MRGQNRAGTFFPMLTSTDSASIRVLEIAHVLFMDIVAYSRMSLEEQEQTQCRLQEAVRATEDFARAQSANQLISLPTGDGMALVFFADAEAPARCALELSRVVGEDPALRLRLGIHSGPVYRVADINANRNVAGGGINIAQRVMDCGDAGHILVSSAVADVLGELRAWRESLHDLGEAEVKHGVKVHIYNLYTDTVGNRHLPQKLRTAPQTTAVAPSRTVRTKRVWIGAAVAIVAVGVAIGAYLLTPRHVTALSEKDTIVLADVINKTGDPVFDDTLRTAVSVSLNESPFLNVLSDNRVAATLKLMSLRDSTTLTPAVAREVCLRANSKAYIAGSISSLGSQYVLGLRAVQCESGDMLAQYQVTATAKEKVLDALGEEVSQLRRKLGESVASVQTFDVPLVEATTSSLEALKAYSLGNKAYNERGAAAALPYHQRAIRLDPNFAMGHRALGRDYETLGQTGSGREYYAKAFALREHTSEREKLTITAEYYAHVTGESEKQAQTLHEFIAIYPRIAVPHNMLSNMYSEQGRYEESCDEGREVVRLLPDSGGAYSNLAARLLALERFDEVRPIIQQAEARKLDIHILHLDLYALAFLGGDSAAMAQQLQWFVGKPEEDEGLSLGADTEAFAGRLAKARELSKKATDSAIRADMKESGAIWQENAALREAAFGNSDAARQSAEEGLKLYSGSLGVQAEAALAFALAGNAARASSLARDLNTRFPMNTHVQLLWLPSIRAQLALNHGDPAQALNDLQTAIPIEFGQLAFSTNLSCLYPTFVRGQAYLASGQGTAAAAEFQKILDHRGIVWNCWTGALARLGVARANALQAKTLPGADADAARLRASAAFQNFFNLWKDADPDIPILKQANAEYAKCVLSRATCGR